MRKTFTLLFALFLFSAKSDAQGFYLKVSGGYAFALPGQTKDGYGNILNGTVTTYSGFGPSETVYKIKTASFASGIHGLLGGGDMINKNIGIELVADVNLGPGKYTANVENVPLTSSAPDVTFTRRTETMVVLMPSIVLQTTKNNWRFYMHCGPALPFNSHFIRQDFDHLTNGTTYQDNVFTWKIKNRFSLGLTTAAGIQYRISENVSLTAEASLLYLSLFRKEADLISITSNGVAISTTQYSGPHTIAYIKNGTSQPSGATQQSFSQPYGNIGASVGIIFRPDHGGKPKVSR